MRQLQQIQMALTRQECRSTAIRVALVVGTLLLIINHGGALLNHEMSGDRWISAVLTYLVPFAVSIHGQSTCQIVP